MRRVGTLGLAKRFRSGITEGLAVSLGQRKPLDVFQLHEWLEADFRPLTDAYSRVCFSKVSARQTSKWRRPKWRGSVSSGNWKPW